MGKKFVYVDDLTGETLPSDPAPKPLTLSVGRTSWDLYLSDDSHDKLLEALDPFIKEAEQSSTSARQASVPSTPRRASASANRSDPEQLQRIREWASQNGHQVAERGRIKQSVLDAYEAAQS